MTTVSPIPQTNTTGSYHSLVTLLKQGPIGAARAFKVDEINHVADTQPIVPLTGDENLDKFNYSASHMIHESKDAMSRIATKTGQGLKYGAFGGFVAGILGLITTHRFKPIWSSSLILATFTLVGSLGALGYNLVKSSIDGGEQIKDAFQDVSTYVQ